MRKLIVTITYDAFAALLQADDGVRCVEAHVDDARQVVRLKFEGVGPKISEGMEIPVESISTVTPKITWPAFE